MSRSHEEHDSTQLEREVRLETQEVRLLKEIVFLLRRLISLVEEEVPQPPVQEMFLPSISATFTETQNG